MNRREVCLGAGGHDTENQEKAVPMRPSRVAVIAIHGVADPKPGSTARRVAGLLAGHRPGNGDFTYQAPTEVPIQIGVRATGPADVKRESTTPSDGWLPRIRRLFGPSFIQPRIREELAQARLSGAGPADGTQLSRQVLADQLAEVELPAEDHVWSTVRIETMRRAGDCEAHVFELYWADLSRLGGFALGTLFDLFQLLFFLPVLGSRTLAFARACSAGAGRSRIWSAWAISHAIATRILCWGVPILNLLLFSLGAVVLLRLFEVVAPELIAVIPGAVLLGSAAGLLYFTRENERWHRIAWPDRFFPISLATVGVSLACWALDPKITLRLAGLALWLGCLALVLGLIWLYDQRLPGVLSWSVVASLVLLAALLQTATPKITATGLSDASIRLARAWVHWGHWGLWLAFALAAMASMVCGRLAMRQAKGSERVRLDRVRWTIDLSLVTSAPMILVLELAIWAALIYLGEELLALGSAQAPRAGVDFAWSQQVASWREILISAAPPSWLLISWVLILLLALAVVVWALWPALRADAHRRRGRPVSSLWVGRSLSAGLRAVRSAGELLRWGLVVVLLPYSALSVWWPDRFLASAEPPAWQWMILTFGALLVATALGRGPFTILALGLRSALDIGFDVLNWLRSDPPGRTPSGRILCRFFSLLHHLESWRHPTDGGGYDAIVIVAHSQGSVIAADGLRLRNPCPLGVHLLTMGSPLRQIYGLRFPDRYGWARSEQAWEESAANPPADLGLASWTNLYHSGDYVGRSLWHPQAAADDDLYGNSPFEATNRAERCLGAGGHNTYWDGHSPDVARALDELIARACATSADR